MHRYLANALTGNAKPVQNTGLKLNPQLFWLQCTIVKLATMRPNVARMAKPYKKLVNR